MSVKLTVRLLIAKLIDGSVYPRTQIVSVSQEIATQWIAANEAEAVEEVTMDHPVSSTRSKRKKAEGEPDADQ